MVEKWPSAIEEGDDSGWTPLHIAAHLGNDKFVKLLLEKDNSPAYVRNKEGLSALHIAANTKNDNRAVMKELMEVCPDMYELLDNKGRNALHVAAESGRWAAFLFFRRSQSLRASSTSRTMTETRLQLWLPSMGISI